jgi:hypothetical protein
MKKLAAALIVLVLALVQNVFACSVSVNDLYQKNLLTAHGASHLNISFSTVNSISITGYSKLFIGEDPVSHCPEWLQTQARISFRYSPRKYETCDASLTVTRREFMGETPTGPIEELSYSEAHAACSTSIPRPRPCIPGRTC